MSRTAARLQSPLAYAAVGASIMAVPASAAALADAPQTSGSGSPIKARVKRPRIEYGRDVVVVGDAPASEQGQTITLRYSQAGSGSWRQIAAAPIGSGGRFRLVGWLRQSGWLMESVADGASAASVSTPTNAPSSSPQRVVVAAAIRVRRRSINQVSARTIDVRGRMLPGDAGRKVLLQANRNGRWATLSAASTGSLGAFTLRYRPSGLGRLPLRVRFAGDSSNAAASRPAGSVTLFQPSVASWYEDGGTTACGFHAYYGVANLSLPCGTKVSFLYGGRVVQAVVDDRGPYVGGRTWDLNENTAAALGASGVVSLWASR